jgi:fucose permease
MKHKFYIIAIILLIIFISIQINKNNQCKKLTDELPDKIKLRFIDNFEPPYRYVGKINNVTLYRCYYPSYINGELTRKYIELER